MSLSPVARARLQASLACAGTLALWAWRRGQGPATLAGVAAALALIAWIAPARYAPFQRALDWILHQVLAGLTWLLLGLVYFLVFTPLRCVRALAGRDPLQRRADPTAPSYLRTLPPASGRFDRQF